MQSGNEAEGDKGKRPHCKFERATLLINAVLCVATIAAAGFAGYAAIIFSRQLSAMQKANKASDAHFVTDERAWLKVEPTPEPVYVDKHGKVIDTHAVDLAVTNTGKTPALFMHIDFGVIDAHVHDAATELRKHCDRWTSAWGTEQPENGTTIFPGQIDTLPVGVDVDPKEAAAAKAVWSKARKNGPPRFAYLGGPAKYVSLANLDFPGPEPRFFGCIVYKTVFGSEWHETRFIYDISKRSVIPKSWKKRLSNWNAWVDMTDEHAYVAN